MKIYSRNEWGARYKDGFSARTARNLAVYAHHSVTKSAGPSATLAQDIATVKAIEAIGQQRFGGGISYTFLVTQAGRVFEGHSIGRVGAHTGGRNSTSAGICFVGNYENDQVTVAQRNAVVALLKHGRAKGWWARAAFTGGHRDVKSTACPGKNVYAQLANFSALAQSAKPTTVEQVRKTAQKVATGGKLKVDGVAGVATITALQRVLGSTADGSISGQWTGNRKYHGGFTTVHYSARLEGSRMVIALQKRLGVTADGHLGPATIKAWQRRLGVNPDGYFGPLSAKALQTKLNQGKAF